MSDLLVGRLPVLDPNISGYRRSLGHQRAVMAPLVVDVLDVTESRSPATLVSPTSARQARPSSETRTFPYTKLSAIVGSDRRNRTPLRSPCARSMLCRYSRPRAASSNYDNSQRNDGKNGARDVPASTDSLGDLPSRTRRYYRSPSTATPWNIPSHPS